jgi:hypothetical protein
MTFLRPALLVGGVFAGVLVALGHAGLWADRNRALLSIALGLYLYAVVARDARTPARGVTRRLAVSLSLLVAFVVAIVQSGSLPVAGSLAWLIWLGSAGSMVASGRRPIARVLPALTILVVAATGLELMVGDVASSAWIGFGELSRSFAHAFTPTRYNPTASGLWVTLIGLAALVAAVSVAPSRRGFGRAIAAAAILLLFQAGYVLGLSRWIAPRVWETGVGLSARLYEGLTPPNWSALSLFSAYDLTAVLGLASGLVVALATTAIIAASKRSARGGRVALLTGLAGLVLVGFAVGTEPRQSLANLKGLKVGVYCPWEHTPPRELHPAALGIVHSGMYGLFLEDLRHRGAEVVSLLETDPKTAGSSPALDSLKQPRCDTKRLAGLDLVVIMVRTRPFEAQELAEIVAYVESGGYLVVVGDHTDLEGCRAPFNELTERYSITLNFDSAFSHLHWWYQNIRVSSESGYPASNGLDAGVGTGGSLSVASPARALVVGPYAFSDLGNVLNSSRKEAFLGDYHYQHGEVLGDQILAAWSKAGLGKVVALGDSSMFQNSLYPRSGRFVRHLLSWTRGEAKVSVVTSHRRWGLAALSGLLLGAIFLARFRFTLLAVGSLITIGSIVAASSSAETPRPSGMTAALVADAGSSVNSDLYVSNSHMSLPQNLARRGWLPDWHASIPAALATRPSLLVLPGPGDVPSVADRAAVDAYLRSGGRVIVTAGRDNRDAANALVTPYGIRVGDEPLGGDVFEPEDGIRPRAVEACLVEPLEKAATVLLERVGRPFVVGVPVGQGTLIVVGDADFFSDGNLETEKSGSVTNTRFFSILMRQLESGRLEPITPEVLTREAEKARTPILASPELKGAQP